MSAPLSLETRARWTLMISNAMPGLSILVSYYYDTFQVNHVLICATDFVHRSNHLRILARVCMSGMTPLSHARYSIISAASHLTANSSITLHHYLANPPSHRWTLKLLTMYRNGRWTQSWIQKEKTASIGIKFIGFTLWQGHLETSLPSMPCQGGSK